MCVVVVIIFVVVCVVCKVCVGVWCVCMLGYYVVSVVLIVVIRWVLLVGIFGVKCVMIWLLWLIRNFLKFYSMVGVGLIIRFGYLVMVFCSFLCIGFLFVVVGWVVVSCWYSGWMLLLVMLILVNSGKLMLYFSW